MESYRFIVNHEPIEVDFLAQTGRSFLPAREVVEVKVGDTFKPSTCSHYCSVVSMDENTLILRYSLLGMEGQLEYSMHMAEFIEEYKAGMRLNEPDPPNFYLQPHSGARDIGPAHETVPPRTVNIADEEHYWNPTPEDAPAPTWPDPLPLEEGSFIQGAARTLRAANDLQNQLQEYRNVIGGPVTVGTTARPDFPEGELRFIAAENNPLQQLEDYVRENFGGQQERLEEKEPVELSKEVWCF